MAAVKIFGRKSHDENYNTHYYTNRSSTAKVLNYIYRVGRDDGDLVEDCRGGLGVNMHSIKDICNDMDMIRAVYNKTDGRQIRHFGVYLNEKEMEQIDDFNALAIDIDKYYSDRFQIVHAAHWKKGKIHFHMCMNSVSYVDGKKYTDKDGDLKRFKSYVDECVQRHMEKISLN